MVRVAPEVPIVLVGNKVDVKDRAVKAKAITFHRKKNLQYYELSVKSNFNIEKPFLYLIRQIAHDNSVHFVEYHVAPPSVDAIPVDPAEIARREADLEKARLAPLPDSDDELWLNREGSLDWISIAWWRDYLLV